MPIVTELSERIKAEGFEHFGFATLKRPFSFDVYRQWLADGHHADMEYLQRHASIKENPNLLMPQARSSIVIAQPYFPTKDAPAAGPRTALYAQIPDYHHWFLGKLNGLRATLQVHYSAEEFLCYTDSSPIAERDLAARAGLGWVGKNGCVIDRQIGSLFFLGEIFTSLTLEETGLVHDHCGTCDRCIRACPTQAIQDNRTLDARRCIAYWNIEAKEAAPEPLRREFSDWFFGCDICQTVCPWNEKVFGKSVMQGLSVRENPSSIESELRWYLTASNREIERELKGSPLLRARPWGLKRNALIVIANRKITSLRDAVESLLHSTPRLEELARWTLAELDQSNSDHRH
jgi:epoxyqueuosine reductase